MLFKEIKEKETIQDLSIQYQKFAEWLRIEVAATIYHLFLAEDNSPELFSQAKRIHSLIPYTIMKNVIRVANPAAVMSNVLDIFLAQPFGARSLMQRIFSLTLNDGIKNFQRSIDALAEKIGDPVFVEKLKKFTEQEDAVKFAIRDEAVSDEIDIIVVILRSDLIEPSLAPSQIERLYNAYVAFNNAVENVDEELRQGAQPPPRVCLSTPSLPQRPEPERRQPGPHRLPGKPGCHGKAVSGRRSPCGINRGP